MKLGILADVHEATDLLRRAIALLRGHGADHLILLGDVFDSGTALEETVALLAGAGAAGVWGNHDLGFCLPPNDRLRQRYGDRVMEYFASLRGRWEAEDCVFTHAQTWMDPADFLEQPWYLHGRPSEPELLPRNFAATEQRVLFQGHYHRWFAATPDGPLPWHGEGPICLEKDRRYLVIVHAVCDGWCALYDTESGVLQPLSLTEPA